MVLQPLELGADGNSLLVGADAPVGTHITLATCTGEGAFALRLPAMLARRIAYGPIAYGPIASRSALPPIVYALALS